MGGVAHRAETRVYRRRPPRELCRREAARGFHRGTPARGSGLGVKLGALLGELAGLFFQTLFQRLFLAQPMLGGVAPDVLRDLHGAELRAAHGAEVRRLGRFLRQGRVVELAGSVRVKAQVELVFPAELEARLAQGVVAVSRAGMGHWRGGQLAAGGEWWPCASTDDAVFHVPSDAESRLEAARFKPPGAHPIKLAVFLRSRAWGGSANGTGLGQNSSN
jgi:hypothetical protein